MKVTADRINTVLPRLKELLQCPDNMSQALSEELQGLDEIWRQDNERFKNAPRIAALRKDLETAREGIKMVQQGLAPESAPVRIAAWRHGIKWPNRITDMLTTLSRITDDALAEIGPKGSGDGARPYAMTAKRALALCAVDLFEHFRPGESSSTKSGNTDEVLSLLYEIATGEEDVSLSESLRTAIVEWRTMQEGIQRGISGKGPGLTD